MKREYFKDTCGLIALLALVFGAYLLFWAAQ